MVEHAGVTHPVRPSIVARSCRRGRPKRACLTLPKQLRGPVAMASARGLRAGPESRHPSAPAKPRPNRGNIESDVALTLCEQRGENRDPPAAGPRLHSPETPPRRWRQVTYRTRSQRPPGTPVSCRPSPSPSPGAGVRSRRPSLPPARFPRSARQLRRTPVGSRRCRQTDQGPVGLVW